ncbi:MAG: hypothetical protein ABGW87_07170 [Sphingomonadaceae bacterium]
MTLAHGEQTANLAPWWVCRDDDRVQRIRLVQVASALSSRILRDGLDIEPIEWMVTRKRLLDGLAPIDACVGQEGFRRAFLALEMGLSLDPNPRSLSGIPAAEFLCPDAQLHLRELPSGWQPNSWPPTTKQRSLYSAYISSETESGYIQIFCAMIAENVFEVRNRLRRRFGPLIEDCAKVMTGFDASEPIACALVSDAIANVLFLIDADPTSEIAIGFDFVAEQRFQN